MNTALRFRTLALTSVLSWGAFLSTRSEAAETAGSVLAAATEAEALPGIFAPKPTVEPVMKPPPLLLRRAGSSERVSSVLRERLLARAKEIDVGALPPTRSTNEVSPLVMERFVVKADKVTRVAPEERASPLLRFVETGRFFESRDGSATGDLRLVPATPMGALPKEPVMRGEIMFTRKF